jgi:ribosomal protein L21E
MEQFTEGDRVRVDIPDTTDPDHEPYHGEHGTIIALLEDQAGEITGDERDSRVFRVDLDAGEVVDFRQRDLRPPLE